MWLTRCYSLNLGETESGSGQCVGAISGQDVGLGPNVWLLGDRQVAICFASIAVPDSTVTRQLLEECVHGLLHGGQDGRIRGVGIGAGMDSLMIPVERLRNPCLDCHALLWTKCPCFYIGQWNRRSFGKLLYFSIVVLWSNYPDCGADHRRSTIRYPPNNTGMTTSLH